MEIRAVFFDSGKILDDGGGLEASDKKKKKKKKGRDLDLRTSSPRQKEKYVLS
jgi:hypothetical protein